MSKAAEREREAATELRQATDILLVASSKFRADSTATVLSGMLQAATLVIQSVADKIESRTS